MEIATVGVVGAGTMGSGIAINIAGSGLDVRLVELSAETLAAAQGKARAFFARQVERGRLVAADADAAVARIHASDTLSALADCDLVIEAVFERLDVKHTLYRELAPILRDDAILATNTSCLRVGALAEGVGRPERFLGLHYFNPPAVNPIVEVVRGDRTDPSVVEAALAFCHATGKQTVACRDSNGFALNRFFCPYVNEAVRLFDEGAGTPFEIDRVACDVLGAAAGPFVVINLVGPQVLLHSQENLHPLGGFYEPAASVRRMGTEGGEWVIGDPTPPDAARDKAIADRLLGAAFLALLQELDETVAAPDEIDLGARLALKFGKPPCALMDSMGRDAVAARVAYFCDRYGVKMSESLDWVGRLTGSAAGAG